VFEDRHRVPASEIGYREVEQIFGDEGGLHLVAEVVGDHGQPQPGRNANVGDDVRE
jgi:hypothetical protein